MDGRKNITFNSYDHRNLPLQMTKGSEVYNYKYDDNGNRIYKDTDGEKEYYLRDHLGREIAIYEPVNDKIKMFNIFGNGLVGRFISGADITLLLTNRTLSGNYQAVNTITVDTNVTVTGTAVLKAGTQITLKPGFHAVQGCNFIAKIDTVSDEEEKVYYIKDHLGSVRVAIDATGDIASAQDYYAYGEILRGYVAGNGNDEKYKFTEKERDTESEYDYFPPGRYYDPDGGYWLQVDPLANIYPAWSPYNYSICNPITVKDIKGQFPASVHADIISEARGNSYIMNWINQTFIKDGLNAFNQRMHFDNYSSFSEINAVILSAGGFNNLDDHTIGDFYSHSNYVDLYHDFKGSKPSTLPLFTEIDWNSDFGKIVMNNLQTSAFPDSKDPIRGHDHGIAFHSKDNPGNNKGDRDTQLYNLALGAYKRQMRSKVQYENNIGVINSQSNFKSWANDTQTVWQDVDGNFHIR